MFEDTQTRLLTEPRDRSMLSLSRSANNVVFHEGLYTTVSPSGRQLLAHELAHSIQQRTGHPVLQSAVPAQPSPGVSFQFAIRISRVLDPDELMIEFLSPNGGVHGRPICCPNLSSTPGTRRIAGRVASESRFEKGLHRRHLSSLRPRPNPASRTPHTSPTPPT